MNNIFKAFLALNIGIMTHHNARPSNIACLHDDYKKMIWGLNSSNFLFHLMLLLIG